MSPKYTIKSVTVRDHVRSAHPTSQVTVECQSELLVRRTAAMVKNGGAEGGEPAGGGGKPNGYQRWPESVRK